ncbi:glutathione peroxidase [Xanthomonas sp. XNM01]|uniref:glutathione peroxidase n=1 Tax=Xanthomonas sp. XNM01 TaxID=2769289 RepID=UPI00177C4F8D|nr:glutathione peroxidase [Xanthomonas sp. XNM01]MBD9368630.1 glutathione peroxidase [Xanthomonas sp. XNM01]
MTTFHDFSATDIAGRPLAMSEFAGQAVLVVNTASRCGFTPQLEGLEALHQAYASRGLVVLGFPCNQFGGQDPGSEAEIAQFCQVNYGVSFPMMAKVEVNGPGAHPLWQWLKAERPGLFGTQRIKWNFTKFLVDRDGHALRRHGPRTRPAALQADIEAMLAR